MKNNPTPQRPFLLVDFGLLLARLIVGGVLVYAGFSKALAPTAEFAAALSNYQIFPTAWLTPMAFAIPWVEIWTGLFLIAGLYTFWAALVASLLFASFLTVLNVAKMHHIDLASCGCFGAETFSPAVTLKMDSGLFVLALVLLALNRKKRAFTADHRLD